MPSAEILRPAARRLFEAGDKLSARKILELVFAREIEEHRLIAANFLGLAEIRLAAGDAPGALDLLRRLVVAVGAPFENIDSAAALLERTGHNAEAIEFLDQLVKSAPWDASYGMRLAKAKLAAGSDSAAAQTSLLQIAASSMISYDLRLKAAAALSGKSHSDLGSGELNLIAAGPTGMNVAQADKFYFYQARIDAAEKLSDPTTKVQLLSHCVVDFPRRNSARVPLFEAARQMKSYRYALGILNPLMQTQFLRNYGSEPVNEEEDIVSLGEAEQSGEDASYRVAADTQMPKPEQARIAQLIGDTMSQVGRIDDALSYYQTARSLETSPALRKALNRKIADARRVRRIQRDNLARQPLLHEALDQDRMVRPKLALRFSEIATDTAQGSVKP